jgi:serine/threonine protein kinase
MAMSSIEPVSELLLRWEELRAEGRVVSAEELCRDQPEVIDEVRRHIRALEAVYRIPRGASVSSQTPVLPPGLSEPRAVQVPGYAILGELGRGGMGIVYKARQIKLSRIVALKMILAGQHTGAVELARFRTEAEAIARLQHPHIVQVYEVGECQGRPFLALEYVDGESLARRCNGTPMPAHQAAELTATLARAVQHAHERGVVHRDLKPGNVLLAFSRGSENRAEAARFSEPRLNEGAVPKIADFGLAKRLDADSGNTRTGEVMGTPSYMAPEQAAGKKDVGPAADVYALGAILYELLTGRPPFKGTTVLETIEQVLTQEPVPPSLLQAKVPRDLDIVCLKCLQKEPGGRYASAAALADDLDRFLVGEPISARGWGLVEQAARLLSRSYLDVRFLASGTRLLWLSPVPLLAQVPAFVFAVAGGPVVAAVLMGGLGGATLMVLGLWLGRRRLADATGPAERLFWSILVGQVFALTMMAVVSWPRSPAEALALYPRWAVLTGLVFCIVGGGFWGGSYLLGLSFFALAILISRYPEAGPLGIGGLLCVGMFVLGVRLRRLGRQRERQHGG